MEYAWSLAVLQGSLGALLYLHAVRIPISSCSPHLTNPTFGPLALPGPTGHRGLASLPCHPPLALLPMVPTSPPSYLAWSPYPRSLATQSSHLFPSLQQDSSSLSLKAFPPRGSDRAHEWGVGATLDTPPGPGSDCAPPFPCRTHRAERVALASRADMTKKGL